MSESNDQPRPRRVTNRREFLQRALLASATGLMWACAPPSQAPAPPQAPPPSVATPPAVVAATTGTAAAVPAAPPAAGARPTGTLTIAQGADTTSLDPQQTQATAPRSMMRSMFESLLIFDNDLKLQPWLATSFSLVNPTTWEFKLRDDVTFHNGEKLTADAVKWSIQRFVDPATKNIYANVLDPVSEVQVIDDYTVRIVTKTPLPSLPVTLATWVLIAPPKAMHDMGDDYFSKPIGSGPYQFVEWVTGERLVVQAADKHWSGGPWVDRLVWRTITEPVARVTALRSGEVDIISGVPPVQVSSVTDGGAQLVRSNSLGIMVLILNASKGPLADKRVRQALNYAIDRDKIIKGLYAGAATPLNGPFITFNEGYDPSQAPYPYDPDKAKQLLAEAGYANGFQFTIDTPNGRYLNDRQVAEASAGDLAKVGVDMSVNPLEWGAMIKLLQEKTSDAILLGQASQDTYQLTSVCFQSKIKGIPWLGYTNPEADSLIDQGGQEMDNKTRADIFKKLGALLYDDAPWVFLQAPQDLYGVGPRVQGWLPKGDQVVYVNGTSVKG